MTAVREYGPEDLRAHRLRGQGTALVEFWANWSAKCRKQAPVLEALAKARPDVVIARVDTSVHRELVEEYGVRAVPTMILFRDGEPVRRVEGLATRQALEQVIDARL